MITHKSDCALHNGPALDPGPCDCGAEEIQRLRDENSNLAAAARMADRRNDELREALKEIARERSDVSATAAADNFQSIARIALSNMESEE